MPYIEDRYPTRYRGGQGNGFGMDRSLLMLVLGGASILVGLILLLIGITGNAQSYGTDTSVQYYSLGLYTYMTSIPVGVAVVVAGAFSLLGSRGKADSVEQSVGLVVCIIGMIFSLLLTVHSANNLKAFDVANITDEDAEAAEALLIVIVVFAACAVFLTAAAMLWFAVHIYGYYFRDNFGDDYPPRYPRDEFYGGKPYRNTVRDAYYTSARY